MMAIQFDTTLPKRINSRVALGVLAGQQRDLFGIFAHAHQVEAEIGLVALLLEIQRDQRPGRSDG